MIRLLLAAVLMFLLVPHTSEAVERSAPKYPEYSLDVSFDISQSKILGTATINAPAHKELVIRTGDLIIKEVRNGRNKIEAAARDGILKLYPAGDGNIVIVYEGVFKGGREGHDSNYGVVTNTIDERGISLTELWYPLINNLCIYDVRATLPEGFTALSEAEEIRKSVINGTAVFAFDFPHPVGGINFIASREYAEVRDTVNGIDLYAYFFREDRSLAGTYIEHAKKYIRLYEDMLGKFPYKRFSIVENFLSSGYSMPTYTLLGREVVRLPFIVETSLGHEILHQWLGNLVYIDYEKGNWAEGLTSYLADHLYEEQKGKGWEYRKQILIDYQSYVNPTNEFPLKDFIGRSDFSSKAIGYGKAAMVFHMLRRAMGDDAFNHALRDLVRERRFQRTSWDDIRRIFEKDSVKDWGWFFRQWVDGTGIPDFFIEAFDMKPNGSKYEASFTIEQKSGMYTLELPLEVFYPGGKEEHFSVHVDKIKTPVTLALSAMPEKVVIDERYDVARRLDTKELPPVVAGMIGAEKPVMVLPVKNQEIYSTVIRAFREKGGVEKLPSEIRDSDMKFTTLIVLGNDNHVAERLYGKIKTDAGFSVTVRHNPWNSRNVVGIIDGKSREEVDAAFGKIFHYGKYSILLFDKGRNVFKKVEETERGINVEQKDQTFAVDVSTVKPFAEVIPGISGKKIVYVGEFHDRFSNHTVELEVIKALHRKNKNTAIGMEMFQRPFQKVLDEYIAGTIDERTMLKGTEYFSRWGFDYNLYRPVLTFARDERIPVIALNLKREITDKVSKAGIDSLSEEEKRVIPSQMDFSDEDYRERLHEVFQKHSGANGMKFDFFYQSQILWDESMSQAIDDFLNNNPDFRKDGQMVVLAGGGHIAYGSGIPKRTFRRNGLDYTIVLNDFDVDKDIANYLVYPKPEYGAVSPKMMVLLKEADGRVTIAGFPEGSISEQAGLRKGDVILSVDDVPVSTSDDIRIHLVFKKKGDPLKVKVLRKGFLSGEVEKVFTFLL